MKRPLVWLAIILCAGISTGSIIRVNFLFFLCLGCLGAVFFIFALFSFKNQIRFFIFVFCLTFILGLLLIANSKIPPRNHIMRLIPYKRDAGYLVCGIVNSLPQVKGNRTGFIFKTETLQSGNLNLNCRGEILAYIKGRPQLSYGEKLILRGRIYRPFKKSHLAYQPGLAVMQVKTEAGLVRLNKNKGLKVKRLALYLKQEMERVIFKYVRQPSSGILDAMILGEKNSVSPLVYNAMMKTGTVHILVVSGFNVGIVIFIVVLFLKLIRLNRRIRILAAIPCLVVYCLMTGASTPVVRATVMGLVFMLAYLYKREPDIYSSLALAAIFILAIDPQQLFNIGFQLSFSSVIAIVSLYPKLKSFVRIELLKIKGLKFLLEAALVSFSAWLGTMGFIAYYFKSFSPVTVLANIFIVPLATLVTLCGFSLVFISLALPPAAPFFAATSELTATLLLLINNLLLRLPFAYLRLP